jgi:hypothetical protein
VQGTRFRRHAAALAVAAVAFAYAWPMQGVGFNQTSHYVLVKAFADGTAVVDDYLDEVGDLGTRDISRVGDRFYSNKAPALAALTLPLFLLLEAAGVRTTGDPTEMMWALGLVGVVLPAVGLLVFVRAVAERLEPGFGTVAAVAMGLGTLVMPFATLFFSHALSAFVVFAAFFLLWRERYGRESLPLVAAAGLVAGLSGVVEYPNAFAAFVLGVYAIARRRWLARGAVYAAGMVTGILPLFLYNQWAFGSPTHLSYAGSLSDGAVQPQEIVFSTYPRPALVLEELFGRSGLLTLAPVLACAVAGWVLLFRRGWRAEALVTAGVSVLYLLYNASFGSNFGGFSAGQRYVIAIIPFLALGLAAAFRAFPATTGALALVSAIVAVSITATHALAGYNAEWLDRISRRDFTATAASLVGVTGWYTILPFFAAAVAAAVLAFLATAGPQPSPLETAVGGLAVLAWALVAAAAPTTPALGGGGDELRSYGVVTAVLAALLAAGVAARSLRPRASEEGC